jgi:hypothetical protein
MVVSLLLLSLIKTHFLENSFGEKKTKQTKINFSLTIHWNDSKWRVLPDAQ